MRLKEFDILLDIKRSKKHEYIEVVQNDFDTNILNISIVDGLESYPLSGLSVEIAFAKPDGTTVLQDLNNGVEIIGDKIVCTLKTNTIAAPGRIQAEVRFLEGSKLLTSAMFTFFVRKSIINENTVQSSNEFPILEKLVHDVTGIIASEESRKQSEYEREQKEQEREVAENERKQFEIEREQKFEGYENRISTIENDLDTNLFEYAQQRSQDHLKIIKIEKELNAYQNTLAKVNVNQEAKQKATGYSTISLPPNAANGQVSVSVKGETRTNYLPTRNFLKGYYGPTGLFETSSLYRTYEPITLQAGTYILSSNQSDLVIITRKNDGTILVEPSKSPVIITLEQQEILKITFRNSTTTTWDFGENLESLNLLLEKGTEVKSFIIGTKSTVSAKRLSSNGAQLWNGEYELGHINGADGSYVVSTTNRRTKRIKVQPNTQYTVSLGNRNVWRFEDINKNFISFANSATVTTPSNCHYVVIYYSLEGTSEKIMLNYGATALPYESYKTPNYQYIITKDSEGKIVELRSLPNGTKDEIRVSGGKGEYIKRVSEPELSTKISATNTAGVNNNYNRIFTINGISTLVGGNRLIDMSNNAVLVETLYGSRDLVENRGKYYCTTAGEVYIISDKSTTPTINHALTYQLAEPEIIPVQVSGSIVSHPSGTVYIEPIVADAGIYTTKINVLHSDLPIKRLEKISKVDFTTGIETELDITKAAISSDKLSINHPELVSGDIVFLEYEYDVEGTQGETTVEYYDSRHVLKDDITGKFYKIVPKVSDGILSNVLVEV